MPMASDVSPAPLIETSLAIGNADVLSGADLNFESTSEVTLANIEAKMQ